MKEDIYEEYRNRLLEENNVLKLEIYETFVGTNFIDNSLDLVDVLQNGSKEEITKYLEYIKANIMTENNNKYSLERLLGYSLIIEGYIVRSKTEITESFIGGN